MWKSAHRAFESIAKHFGMTRDAWSLKDASTQLLEGMHLLVGDDSCCCCRCGGNFPGVAGLVADAGQCYEMIDAKGALSEAFVLLRRFQAISASSTVTVKTAKKRISWFGGRALPHSSKCKTWDVSQLSRLFSAAMSVNMASVGHHVFEILGVPIGGLLSKVATTIARAQMDRECRPKNCSRFQSRFPVATGGLSRQIY